jgi:hypothetical protein
MKRYRVKYVTKSGMYLMEYCFRKRKKFLWQMHQAGEIKIVHCDRAGRGTFWSCLRNNTYILN